MSLFNSKVLLSSVFFIATAHMAFADGISQGPRVGGTFNCCQLPIVTTPGVVRNDASGYESTLNVSPYGPTLFGTGKDGTHVCNSSETLTTDMHYTVLTLSAGCSINPAGFRIFASQNCDFSSAPSGAIAFNGLAGGNAVGSAAGQPAGALSGGKRIATPFAATAAGAGSVAFANNSSNASIANFVEGGNAGTGGIGGNSTNLGGTAGTPGTGSNTIQFPTPTLDFFGYFSSSVISAMMPGPPSSGGGGGGGDGTNISGGGGGAAGGGGTVALYCRFINRGTNTNVAIIQSKGGNGGNGGNSASTGNSGGGGGGGGAGGGFVYIVSENILGAQISNAIDVTGGNGGNGGNGNGSGLGGSGGQQARSGSVQILNLSANSFYTQGPNNTTGTNPVVPSTSTGATGNIATVQQYPL